MKKKPGEKYLIDPVRYSFWMFGEDGSEFVEMANNEKQTAQLESASTNYLASLNAHRIAGFIVIFEWRDPVKTPLIAHVRLSRKKLPDKLVRKLEKTLRHHQMRPEKVFTSNDTPLPKVAGKKPKRKTASPATVGDVLQGIRSRKTPRSCNPGFPSGISSVFVSDALKGYCSPHDIQLAVDRFIRCDWGDVSATQARRNNASTRSRTRNSTIRGAYWSRPNHLTAPKGVQFWLVLSPSQTLSALLTHELEEFR